MQDGLNTKFTFEEQKENRKNDRNRPIVIEKFASMNNSRGGFLSPIFFSLVVQQSPNSDPRW